MYWNQTKTWKFDLSDCHCLLTVQNPAKKSLFEDVFKVSALSFHTSSKSLDKAQYGLVDGVLWQIIPYCLQDFLQLFDGIWLGLKCPVAFKHSSPDMEIKGLRSGEFGGHSSFPIKSLQLVAIQFWASFAVWAGAPSCWKMKPDGKSDLQSSTNLGNKVSQ